MVLSWQLLRRLNPNPHPLLRRRQNFPQLLRHSRVGVAGQRLASQLLRQPRLLAVQSQPSRAAVHNRPSQTLIILGNYIPNYRQFGMAYLGEWHSSQRPSL